MKEAQKEQPKLTKRNQRERSQPNGEPKDEEVVNRIKCQETSIKL